MTQIFASTSVERGDHRRIAPKVSRQVPVCVAGTTAEAGPGTVYRLQVRGSKSSAGRVLAPLNK